MTCGGISLNIILCEGKTDTWFFDEIFKNHIDEQIYAIPDKGMAQLQKLYDGNCFEYIRSQFALIIFGDSGRPTIYDKVLPRVAVDMLGRFSDDIYISIILDDDGTEYENLEKKVLDSVKLVSKNRLKFTHSPIFEENDGLFILRSSKSKGTFTVNLLTVPISLEEQIANKFIGINYRHDHKILENGPHSAIDFIANKYYSGDREKLVRDASAFLKNEIWIKEIVNYIF